MCVINIKYEDGFKRIFGISNFQIISKLSLCSISPLKDYSPSPNLVFHCDEALNLKEQNINYINDNQKT